MSEPWTPDLACQCDVFGHDRYCPNSERIKLRRAVARLKSEGYSAINFDCYNKAEAQMLRAMADVEFPEIQVRFTWIFQ